MKAASFQLNPPRPRLLLLGENDGIEPILGFAESLLRQHEVEWKPLVLLGSDQPLPFRAKPSTILVPGIPDGTIACVPKLDEFGIPSRLASRVDLPGCFDGSVVELARAWLASLDSNALAQVEVFACGRASMLDDVTQMARQLNLPVQPLATNS